MFTFEEVCETVARANEIFASHVCMLEEEMGRPLTVGELNVLTHCQLCQEPNGNCTHDQ